MICRNCSRAIDDDSIYCKWCGQKQLRERKKKQTISVPKPRQLKSGAWNIELRAEKQSVTEATPELCIAKARAIRAGFLDVKRSAPPLSLSDAMESYIEKRRSTLSPSTVNGYESIKKTRFLAVSEKDIHAIDWQSAVNAEALLCSAKTLKNAWGFVAAVLRENKADVPELSLPQVVKKEQPWLDYEQIGVFLSAVRDEPCELTALLALHSLRRSEILGLTSGSIDLKKELIHVEGAAVMGSGNKLVHKDTNKNTSSRRVVPIMIPRLKDILPSVMEAAGELPLVRCNPNTMHGQINAVCRRAGLPLVGVHGLRRSFASLAYHLGWSELDTMSVGGWSDFQTMRDLYTKLAAKDRSRSVRKMERFYSANSRT